MAESEVSGTNIIITVKTPKDKKDITTTDHALIKDVKELIKEKFSAEVSQICLIFAGKILKDGDTLNQIGIKNGMTVHLVIKSQNKAQEQAAGRATTAPAPPPANVADTPMGLGGLGGLAGLGGMGMGSANFMEMQQRMQREMMSNPEMLQTMMENPFIQQMMSNPDVMRQLITSNPQMRELMERNPEITHMLNNPELMRQTMEIASNPSMMQELMRTQDRAMSNLESLPGGFNALQRMYRDIQEPMMNAASEGMGASNPFAALSSDSSGQDANQQQGQENVEPLPNPWAPAGSNNATSTTQPSGTAPTTTSSGGLGASMFNTPGMQSLMGQMSENPQLMQNMLQAPYMQNMMQSLSTNPELANQIIGNNPFFAGNPQLQEQMQQHLPTFLQQMQNPEVQNMMTNPRALDAIRQIQQGMQQLQTEAPGLLTGMPGMPTAPGSTAPAATTGTTTTSSSAPVTTTTTATPRTMPTTTPSVGGGTTGTAPVANQDQLNNFMAQMMTMMGSAGGQNTQQPPEQRFAAQLEQLAGMGFPNRDANIRALTATFGDVNAAIDRLLQQS